MRSALCLLFVILVVPGGVFARDHVEVAGSSTVLPFTAVVMEHLRRLPDVSVVNRSTGTGGGMRAFCAGCGNDSPDVTAASRRMTEEERKRCEKNGVTGITELAIGYDGIVFANSVNAFQVDFTREQLYKALAGKVVKDGQLVANPYKVWREIDPTLPGREIKVVGPPSTSGTRDTFEKLAVQPPCEKAVSELKLSEEKRSKVCTTLRRDGAYIELGEDDLEFIKRLSVSPGAFGIFGYSYVVRYSDIVRPNSIDGVWPTPESIEDGSYPLSRPLYLYVKHCRLRRMPGLGLFLKEYLSDKAIGPEGYLVPMGLVPLKSDERKKVQSELSNLLKK